VPSSPLSQAAAHHRYKICKNGKVVFAIYQSAGGLLSRIQEASKRKTVEVEILLSYSTLLPLYDDLS
jgi:hypothetical protein